jgi:hypothetical protein
MKTTINISNEDLAYILYSAFESGSNYWIKKLEYEEPVNFNNTKKEDKKYKYVSCPLNEGGSVFITDQYDKKSTLNLEKIKTGLKIMTEKYPKTWSRIFSDNYDANDADVFLQVCLFGETIYG